MTIKYLLDTDICIYLTTERYPHLQTHFVKHAFESIAISSITMFELLYGVAKSKHHARNYEAMHGFLHPFEILNFTDKDAEISGKLRAWLASKGTPIGPYDVLLAGQALNANLTLVTNNVREFERVPNLNIENWVHYES